MANDVPAPNQNPSIFGAGGQTSTTSTTISNPFASASTPFGNGPTLGSAAPPFTSNKTPATTNPFASAVSSSSAPQKPTVQPTLLGGGAAVNPFAQAAPTPSMNFQGFQTKTPPQPPVQPSGNQSGFPLSSTPATVNGIAPASKISFGEAKPSLSGPFGSNAQPSGGDKTSMFSTPTDTAQKPADQPKSNFFASPSSAFAPASTSKPTSSTGAPAIAAFPTSTGTSSSIPSSGLGLKPSAPTQEPPKLDFGNKPSFTQTGGSLNFPSSNTPGIQAAKSGLPNSPFSGSLLGLGDRTGPQSPVKAQPGTPKPSSIGFPRFDSPTRLPEPAGSTTPTSSPPRNASASFLFPTSTPAPVPAPAPIPEVPPRDLLGDFTNWFVNGDKGLMKEFEVFMVESIVRGVYDKFQKDEEERIQREKEERDSAEAKRFRVYNLSLKYFYRWKKNAREKRLRHLRRSGREQFRAFREAQRAAQLREEQETAQRVAKQKAELAALNRPDELASILKKSQHNKRKAEEALLASGVLSGVTNERRAVSAIFRNDYRPSPTPSINGSQGLRSRSGSIVSTEGGSKTRALREKLLGEKPGRFRHSLPSISGDSSPPEKSRISKVSERWRLKAMGIVQMPDGTALPESMVDEIRRGLKRDTSSVRGSPSIRRASITGAAAAAAMRQQSPLAPRSSMEHHHFSDNPLTINNKRKRSTEDEGETAAKEGVEDADPHKRVMSDADLLIQELRAMRQEMEEGTTWFKSQNGKLQSDILSRGGTPLDESIM